MEGYVGIKFDSDLSPTVCCLTIYLWKPIFWKDKLATLGFNQVKLQFPNWEVRVNFYLLVPPSGFSNNELEVSLSGDGSVLAVGGGSLI